MSPIYWGIVSDVDAGRIAGDRRIGGVSASMYRLTVSLWRPNSLAILRMDMPSSLAFCTASQRACCRNVDLLGEVVTVMETTSASSMTEPRPFAAATIVSGSGAVSRGSLRPLGSGDWLASPEEGLMPFRSDPGLGGASWAAMMRPSCCNDSRPSSPCSTTPPHRHSCGVAGQAATAGVKGGEKMYRVGGSTGVFGLSTSSEKVPTNWPAIMMLL